MIGEKLHIEDVGGEPPAGFRDSAPVARIERNFRTGVTSVILEAVPAAAKPLRNVVRLNENYIPRSQRRHVEELLRRHLDLPGLRVEPQHEARAHHRSPWAGRHRPSALGQLQAKIRKLLDDASPLAVI